MNALLQRTNIPTMPAPISIRMSPRTWALLIVLSFLWGVSFFFNEIAIREVPPLTISMVRVGGAALVFWLFILATGRVMPRSLRLWGAFLIMGVLNNAIPFSLIAYAQIEITSSLASIIISTTPLFAVVIAGLVLPDERLTLRRFLSAIIGFCGIVIMIGPSVLTGIGSNVIAQFAMLGAALFYALSTIYARRFKEEGLAPSVLVTGQVTMSSLFLIPVALYFDQSFSIGLPSWEVIGALLGITFLSTALAYIIYFKILSVAGATNVTLVAFLIPISAILLGVGILRETLTLDQFFGMLMIALGLAIMDGRLVEVCRRKLTSARAVR